MTHKIFEKYKVDEKLLKELISKIPSEVKIQTKGKIGDGKEGEEGEKGGVVKKVNVRTKSNLLNFKMNQYYKSKIIK